MPFYSSTFTESYLIHTLTRSDCLWRSVIHKWQQMYSIPWEGGELSTGIIFVYRISTINLLLSGIPTPSATNLFIIWLICVKTRVYIVTQFPQTPFTFSGGKTTRNTSHSSAVFPCITTARNRWHLLIENRWSCLYAAGAAPPLARLLFVCCVCRHTCYWKSVGAWREGQINQAHFIWEALMLLVKDGMLHHPSAQLLICH